MSQKERFGTRDNAYSAWHRSASTRRFVGPEKARELAMIDTDAVLWVELADATKAPLALIETAQDVGQAWKCSTAIQNLARCSGLPAFVVLYRHATTLNPADGDSKDILDFRVKRLHPNPTYAWKRLSPQEWADALVEIRREGGACLERFLKNEAAALTQTSLKLSA